MNTFAVGAMTIVIAAAPLGAERERQPASACASVDDVVGRAVAYVAKFGQELGSVIASEDYRQELAGPVDVPTQVAPPISISPGVQALPAPPLANRQRQVQSIRSSFLFV